MSIITCQSCGKYIDTDLNWCSETEVCEPCVDAYHAKMYAHYKPLYDAEKAAGLLDLADETIDQLKGRFGTWAR